MELSDNESTVVANVDSLLSHRSCNSSVVSLDCRDLSEHYNESTHKNDLILILNNHSDTYPDLKCIRIWDGTHPDLVCVILLHFVRKHSHSMQSFELHECNVSSFFMHINDLSDIMNGNKNAVILNSEIILEYSSISGNNNAVHTAITNCPFFTSWTLDNIDPTDLIFVLNALAQNVYIQSLRVVYYPFGASDEEDETLIDSITHVVTCTKNLSNLELYFECRSISFDRAWTGLIDALIKSDSITSLSFESLCFENVELLHKFYYLFKTKTNIQTLRLDSSMFYLDTDSFNRNSLFDASVFFNLLQRKCSQNKNYLRELYFDFESMNGVKTSQEIMYFFALLNNSDVEKLIIRANLEFTLSLNAMLYVHTIPFMKRLCYFDCSISHEMSRGMQKLFLKSIGQCSRTLTRANTPSHLFPEASFRKMIKMFLKRNSKLTAVIKNKTKFCRSAWPKIFSVSKPTGPDATFHFLCNLSHSVGPDESLSMTLPRIVPNVTTTINKEQNKRKFT